MFYKKCILLLSPDFALTNGNPYIYLTLTGKLWYVFREYLKEKWPR